jgi:hypothetical protein
LFHDKFLERVNVYDPFVRQVFFTRHFALQ